MYNLLVKYGGWADGGDRIPASRLFGYTEPNVKAQFQADSRPAFERLLLLPALIAAESDNQPALQIVRVGTITRARIVGRELALEYSYDLTVPALSNADLIELAADLEIEDWELSRTHWAIKQVDLFRVLIRRAQPRRLRPRVFTLHDPERVEPTLVSLMMPFDAAFEPVHHAVRAAIEEAGLSCRRADDIWENPAIIQDIVSLIDRSRVVICDCTGRNPNVFYETGIAHTLGREVILITQSASDIPFDLRHLRHVAYLNNGEGREELKGRLSRRLADLVGS